MSAIQMVDYATGARRRVARRAHRCEQSLYGCPRIQPGDVYLEVTTFPGHDSGYATQAGRPVRIAACARCTIRLGRDYGLLDPIPYEQRARDGLL